MPNAKKTMGKVMKQQKNVERSAETLSMRNRTENFKISGKRIGLECVWMGDEQTGRVNMGMWVSKSPVQITHNVFHSACVCARARAMKSFY